MVNTGFLLSAESHDSRKNELEITYWGITDNKPLCIKLTQERPLFFIPSETQAISFPFSVERRFVGEKLKSFNNEPVDALYFKSQKDYFEGRRICKELKIKTFEEDLWAQDRYLMERFINGALEIKEKQRESHNSLYINPLIRSLSTFPAKLSFKVLSFDIETGQNGELYSIAFHLTHQTLLDGKELRVELLLEKVYMMDPKSDQTRDTHSYIDYFSSEKLMLQAFLDFFKTWDPDFIIGWHVIGFDLLFLEKKFNEHRMEMTIGRGNSKIILQEKKGLGYFADISGRLVLDGVSVLRNAFYKFENFKLETVAQALLGKGKDIQEQENEGGLSKVAEIEHRFQHDKVALAQYNLIDAKLVTEIFDKTRMFDHLLKRSFTSGMLLDKIGASTRAFDHFYLPRLHRKGYVAPNVTDFPREQSAVGGLVLEPVSGFHEHVIVLDFKSLYPSLISTFKIDPLSRLKASTAHNPISTPSGHSFSPQDHLLPNFIDELMQKREIYNKAGDLNLAQSIKILMNSFYGVMGSTLSRFYHADLPSAITETGQSILKLTVSLLQKQNYKVICGDTDSLFVKLNTIDRLDIGKKTEQLTREINNFLSQELKNKYGVDSKLSIKFEKYFSHFFVPMPRGFGDFEGSGAKKKYVGLWNNGGKTELYFSGMEVNRTDWTELAKIFQHQLYTKFFNDEDIIPYIKETVQKLRNGDFNHLLVYKKKLSKHPKEYTKNIPPHVQAALKLKDSNFFDKEISYVMTYMGPTPTSLPHQDIDIEHYLQKQIAPVAEAILLYKNLKFEELISGGQLSLF